ncbi:hypothetical protein [Gemella cuniculi]|uniref:hypothetical protein n=1 Tax=Gemella cuniculi TaxID=150240 RepID=UPI0012EB323F|nr:hypothetical protein [Gemella cuniculi]
MDGYLSSITDEDKEIVKTIFIEMKRQIKTASELRVLNKHIEKLNNYLEKKGLIKQDENERTTPRLNSERKTKKAVEQRMNNETTSLDQNQMLLEILQDRLELLEKLQSEANQIKPMDYSRDKVKSSNRPYSFNLNYLDEIIETKKAIEEIGGTKQTSR